MMKNVAIFNTCISGSTGKIAVGLFDYLKEKGYDVSFFYGREDGDKKNNYHRMGWTINKYMHAALAKSTGLQGYGSWIPTLRTIKELKHLQIDTIYIVSPHGYYLNEPMLWNYIMDASINVVYLMIDEYAYLGNCGYSNGCLEYQNGCKNCPREKKNLISKMVGGASKLYSMKKRIYSTYKQIQFVGPEYTLEKAKNVPMMRDLRMMVVDEAVNTDFYYPRDTKSLKQELHISEDKIVCVCVAPYSYERKGVRYFVELARRFEYEDGIEFVHVGFDVPRGSVELPSNYHAIGYVDNQDILAQYYALGDLFVFPSLLDTMPNACLEALSAGTPLLCFNISGMPYIADDTVATFVEPCNVDQMAKVVRNIRKKTEEQIQMCRNYALKRYNNQNYYEKLCVIAEDMGLQVL